MVQDTGNHWIPYREDLLTASVKDLPAGGPREEARPAGRDSPREESCIADVPLP